MLRQGDRVIVTIELSEARTARIVWTEVFDAKLDDAFQVLDEIGNRIVASIASEIEAIERNRAILKPPNSLDAWEAYHRGLWHMYRFNKADNDRAEHFFQMSVPRSNVRTCLCRSVIHSLAERLSALGRARTRKQPGVRDCGPEPHRRRSRSRSALGHGAGALAARPPRRVSD